MPTWTFVEPTLAHGLGHQPGYLRAVRAQLPADVRLRVIVPAGPRTTPEKLALGEGIEVCAWPIPERADRGNATLRWARTNADVADLFGRIGTDSGPGDVVTSTSCPGWLLAGFASGALLLPRSVHTLACLYGFEAPWKAPGSATPASWRLRSAATTLTLKTAVVAGRLTIGAQTQPVAAAMQKAFGVPVTPLPMLVNWDHAPLIAPRAESGLPRLTWLGQVRNEKGFARYVRLATALRSQVAPHGQFTPDNQMSEREFEAALAPLRDLPGAQIHTGHADDATYAVRFAESDLVALPYARSSYWQRTSGVLVETLGHGRVPVVSGDTWLADFARLYGGGVELGDESTDADVVRAALPGLRERLARAAAAAPRVRAEHNATTAVQAMIRLAEGSART